MTGEKRDSISAKHEKHCREFLEGVSVDETLLWCSVGFFYAGRGVGEKNPFAKNEWARLLLATGRPLPIE